MKPDALAISSGHIIQLNATTPIAYALNIIPLGCTFSSTPREIIGTCNRAARSIASPVLQFSGCLISCGLSAWGEMSYSTWLRLLKIQTEKANKINHDAHQALACSAILNASIEEDVQ